MDEETLDRLGRSPNFCGIKESSGDINRLHMIARDYPHLGLLCGMDDQALEFFAWGARSWVCAGSNFAPEAHIAMYRACAVEGDFSKGRAIMSAMLPLMSVLEQGGDVAGSKRPPLGQHDDRLQHTGFAGAIVTMKDVQLGVRRNIRRVNIPYIIDF